MIRSKRMFTGLLIATVVPGTLGAQTITQSFGDLQQVLKVNQLIVVTDETGEKTKGRVVANVSTSSLTPQVKATKRNPQGTQTLHRQYGLNDRTRRLAAVPSYLRVESYRWPLSMIALSDFMLFGTRVHGHFMDSGAVPGQRARRKRVIFLSKSGGAARI